MFSVNTEWPMSNSPFSVIAISAASLWRGYAVIEAEKKQFKATYLSWTSWLRKKDVSIAWKQTSDIKLAIKTVQPTLCPTTLWLTVCTVLSAGRSTSDFSAPIISLLHMTSHSASIMSMTECSVCGKKTHPHSGQPLTLWLSSSVRWGGTSWSD